MSRYVNELFNSISNNLFLSIPISRYNEIRFKPAYNSKYYTNTNNKIYEYIINILDIYITIKNIYYFFTVFHFTQKLQTTPDPS